jgi:hypothetical protein
MKEKRAKFFITRVVLLSEKLMDVSKAEALFTIAHEIAHSRTDIEAGYESECEADKLAEQ